MESIVLKAIERTGTKKKAAKAVRAQGYVPGIVYGNDNNILVGLPVNDLEKLLLRGGSHSIINLDVEGSKKKHIVVLKEVQRNPIKGTITHADFQIINLDQVIEQTVRISVVGEEKTPGIRAGGVIQNATREVVIKGKAKDLPDHIDADISNLEIGDQFKVSDLKMPKGIEVLTNPDEGIVAIVQPVQQKEEEVVTEAAEPEEIAKGEEAEQE